MNARPPFESVKPAFNFEPDEEPTKLDSPSVEREVFKAKTAEAFEKADYVPPERKQTANKPTGKRHTKEKVRNELSSERLPFRRPRGRPKGQRKHALSVKTTEHHLAFLYGVAGEGELVGVLEAALEALAREVDQTGSFQGTPLEKGILEKAKTLTSGRN